MFRHIISDFKIVYNRFKLGGMEGAKRRKDEFTIGARERAKQDSHLHR
jgi:hypothetical protein